MTAEARMDASCRDVTVRGSLAKMQKQRRCKGVFKAGTFARGPLAELSINSSKATFAPLVPGPLCLFARDPRPVTGGRA